MKLEELLLASQLEDIMHTMPIYEGHSEDDCDYRMLGMLSQLILIFKWNVW